MTPSKILFLLNLSFIGGVVVESCFNLQTFLIGFILFFVIIFLSFFIFLLFFFSSQKELWNKILFGGFLLLFFIIGILRMEISEFKMKNDSLREFKDKEVELVGIIIDNPDVREKSQKLKLKIENFASKILVITTLDKKYFYLDKIEIKGKIEVPFETEEFSYKNYLLKENIYWTVNFPQIDVLERPAQGYSNVLSLIYGSILKIKERMREIIRNNFYPPYSSLVEGMILGERGAISSFLREKFKITGLSHIIAISGLHIVIITAILMNFLLLLGFWRSQAVYLVLFILFLYVIFVGSPPSAFRASIMGGLYLLSQNVGREVLPLRLLALTASLMILLNPFYLFYDIGFQLSFLAVLGLFYLEPLIRHFFKILFRKYFNFEIKKTGEKVLRLFSATLGAQIFTLPLIVFNFGTISFVSPLANFLILPIIPFIMFFALISSFLGLFSSLLSWFFSLPCYFLMIYFFKVVDFLSSTWSYKIIKDVSWFWVLAFYVIFILVIRYFHYKNNNFFVMEKI